ncbi:MAG: peptide chain release factor N(5)-glutamine methyltransferase [Bacteroidetes bacterium]|nr:peptide chain release factor N(5)-glutamine methyltransferase [Bacteroidota bacterium]
MPQETVLSLLKKTTAFLVEKGIDEAKRSAEYLLAHALGQKRLQLYLRFDQPVSDEELERYRPLVRRRLRREPVQHIIGGTEFYGLEFGVSPEVLIPRPETEHLIEAVVDRCRASARAGTHILDIGTGSGVIAVTLARQLPEIRVTAIDNSDAALSVAADNARLNAVDDRIVFSRLDFLAAEPGTGPYDIVVSNPPYIPADDMATLQPEVRDFEPSSALTDHADGLTFYRRIALLLPSLLVRQGLLAVEIGYGQAADVVALFESAHLREIEIIRDYSGIERIILGRAS